MITTQDKELLAKKGITEAQIAEQLACFQTGFPFLKLDAAASIEKGILAPDAEEQKAYLAAWDAYKNTDKTIVKFVPASGAASRMFKNLFEFLSAEYDKPTTKFEQAFFDGIRNFAFYDDLNVACQRTAGKDIPGLLEEGNYKAVVAALLETAGLNYGALPKGLLKFHKYPEGPRTPLEEHLAEGAMYAAGKSGKVNVHFTVSTEHRELFKKLVEEKTGEFAKRYGVDYYITFSEQKPSTDTIAADMDNQPFRDNGKLLFRPGGHGALIENLNDLDADIIFIKNIDNVVPDKLKADTVTYKKLIAGVLVTLQKKAFEYLELLDSGKYPVLRVGNFFSNRGWYYSNLELSEDKYCDNGDLLYAWSASFGPQIWNGGKAIYHYHIWKVLVGKAYNKQFLCNLLEYTTESLMNDTHGIAMMHLTKSGMEKNKFIVPPMELQEQFAAFVEQTDKSKYYKSIQILKLITEAIAKEVSHDRIR